MVRHALATLPGIAVWALVVARPTPPPAPGVFAGLGALAAIVACYVLGSRASRRVRWTIALVDLSAVAAALVALAPGAQSAH